MSKKRELIRTGHMTVQYVWALENDRAFMEKARHDVDRGNYERFCTLVAHAIHPTRRLLGEAYTEGINADEWSFLFVELWCRLGGRFVDFPLDMDCVRFKCHVDRLRAAGYGFSRDGIYAFVPTNTAEKDLNRYLQDVKAVVAATDALVSNNPCAEIELGQPQTCTLENEMSQQIIIANKTYINNVDVTTMSDDQLIDAIKKVEKEIEDLGSVKTKSKKIEAKVSEANETLSKLVTLLDAR